MIVCSMMASSLWVITLASGADIDPAASKGIAVRQTSDIDPSIKAPNPAQSVASEQIGPQPSATVSNERPVSRAAGGVVVEQLAVGTQAQANLVGSAEKLGPKVRVGRSGATATTAEQLGSTLASDENVEEHLLDDPKVRADKTQDLLLAWSLFDERSQVPRPEAIASEIGLQNLARSLGNPNANNGITLRLPDQPRPVPIAPPAPGGR